MTDFESRYNEGPFGVMVRDDERHMMFAIKRKKNYSSFMKVLRAAMATEIDARYSVGPASVDVFNYSERDCVADISITFTQDGDEDLTTETWELEMATIY